MSEPQSQTGKKSVGAELILPAGALVFTLYYFSTIVDSPWTAQVAALFTGSILIALILVFAGRIALLVSSGKADLGMKDIVEPLSLVPARCALIGLTILFAVLIDWGGFTLTSFAYMAAAMIMLNRGRAKGRALLISAAMSLAGWGLFIFAFGIRFPKGPFERLMDAIL